MYIPTKKSLHAKKYSSLNLHSTRKIFICNQGASNLRGPDNLTPHLKGSENVFYFRNKRVINTTTVL